jgi:hypothetical protein
MKPWFPLPNNLVYKGAEWIPELKIDALVSFFKKYITLSGSDIAVGL